MSFNYMQPFVTLAGGLQTQNAAGATEFNSMYESFNALTTVNKQHFVEWFSGSALDSIWTSVDVVGSSTAAIDDSVDGGILLTTGASTSDGIRLGFNNKRQYAHNGAVGIFTCKKSETASNDTRFGIANNAGTGHHDSSLFLLHSDGTVYGATYPAGGGEGATSTGLSTDTSWHSYKIENKSASVEFTVDGVLKATRTTNLSTDKGQPALKQQTATTASKSARWNYCEVYNT